MACDTLVMQWCHAMPVGFCMMVGHWGGTVSEILQRYDHFFVEFVSPEYCSASDIAL